MIENSPHSETTDLLSLELDLLEEEQRRATLRHLEACTTCRMRREEVRSGLTTLAEETRGAFDERNHVPSDLLEEYASAPSGLGAEVVSVIESHLSQCSGCREEAARAREATQDVWPTQAVSGQLDARIAARSATGSHGPVEAPRRRAWWGVAAAAAAAIVLLLVLRPLLVPKPPAIEEGMPVRLFGSSGPGAPASAVAVPAGVPVILLLKFPVAPDPLARYRVELRGAPGLKLAREISGGSFDRLSTVAVAVDSKHLSSGEAIEVRVVPAGGAGGAPLFIDSFRVERTP